MCFMEPDTHKIQKIQYTHMHVAVVHPSTFYIWSGDGSRGQNSAATFSSSSRGVPRRSQASRDIVPPACSGSSWGPPTCSTCPERLIRETSEPPHLTPEEQQLYTDSGSAFQLSWAWNHQLQEGPPRLGEFCAFGRRQDRLRKLALEL